MIEIFGLVGLTLIVTRSRIFEMFRQWWLDRRPNDLGYLFSCPQCLGFWMGFGVIPYTGLWTSPFYAGAVSLLSFVIDQWLKNNQKTSGS